MLEDLAFFESKAAALERLKQEIDRWVDNPVPINNNKLGKEPHPVWLAVVELQRHYPKNRLPKLVGALDAWADLCKYSRLHGNEPCKIQDRRAKQSAVLLNNWVISELKYTNLIIDLNVQVDYRILRPR